MSAAEVALVETLADIEHDRWARWMKWVYENGTWNSDGSFTIASDKAKRWALLADQPYGILDDATKEWDRAEARKSLAAVRASDGASEPDGPRGG